MTDSPQITAEVRGRRLRLAIPGTPHVFLVDPLPAKRGRALSEAYASSSGRDASKYSLPCVFAEALGAENYALLTGDAVQEFDATGNYLRTCLPDAIMVEPDGEVPAPAPGQRVRIIASPWDGLDLRSGECMTIVLEALAWQTDGSLPASAVIA
jgi:hypothetical protein